jgi:hypothetical protein
MWSARALAHGLLREGVTKGDERSRRLGGDSSTNRRGLVAQQMQRVHSDRRRSIFEEAIDTPIERITLLDIHGPADLGNRSIDA